jgi:hypothetical protein
MVRKNSSRETMDTSDKVEETLKAVVPLLRDLTIVSRGRTARSTVSVAWMRLMIMLSD